MTVRITPELHNLIIKGFNSHELEFQAAFDRSTEEERQRIHQQVVSEAAGAEIIAEQGRFCSVVIAAYSDRVDNAASPEAARADELEVSRKRAEDARVWLVDRIRDVLRDAGAPVPADQDELQSVNIFWVACGAARLLHPVPTPEQRPENRRIEFAVASFFPPEEPVL